MRRILPSCAKHGCFAVVVVVVSMVLLVLTPTGVSSFSVSLSVLEKASVSTATPALFRERRRSKSYLKWRNDCTTTTTTTTRGNSSLISLRGGNSSSDTTSSSNNEPAQPIDSNKKFPFSGGSSSEASSSEAYYLVWSPGFLPKLALATILLALVRRLGWDQKVFGLFLGSLGGTLLLSGLVPNLLMPLLSSSCCAIQLAVNAGSAIMGAGAGCIGFNTVLGPVRPYLLAMMLAYHNAFGASSPSTTLLRYAVALMPEIVFGWNELLRSRWRTRTATTTTTTTISNTNNNNTIVGTTPTTTPTESTPVIQATLIVEVPTMGCVACVNKIESSLRKTAPNNIETASSWLNPKQEESGTSSTNSTGGTTSKKKGGRAKIEVRVSSREELDDLARSLVGAIEDAGFRGSTIETLEIQE